MTKVVERSSLLTPHQGDIAFRHLLEKLPAAAYTCDAAGLITYFNNRALELWGRAPKLNDAVDRFCGSFRLFATDGSPVPHDQCWMARALRDGKEYNGHEIIIERPDGSRWFALAHANPIHDQSGNICGAVNVLVDITQRKRTEEALRASDRDKDEFLAILAHELRNPLAPLRNGLQIMELAKNDGVMVAEVRQMMVRQLGHMVRLIDDLLDLSRVTQGKIELRKEQFDLALVIRDAVETSRPLIEAYDHKLSVLLPRTPILLNADRTRLTQVFANLLNNSAKYTHQGGHIQLIVVSQDTEIVVRVIDDGIGIAADVLPRIFNILTQGQRMQARSGLGIGLSVVRGLVELHGGFVEAHSDGHGKGSEFIVHLPIATAPAGESRLTDVAGDDIYSVSPRRVLVVEDNRDSANSLVIMLKQMGHDTRAVYDGLEAVNTVNTYRPHIVLLDIDLPSMNGYDVCRRIRREPWAQDIICIALTGWGQHEDKCNSKAAGFDFHLTKPCDPDVLGKLLAGLPQKLV
ncbi:MAG: hybrid sensor histidine kinase/response regulator [Sulfuricaulis sp.]